MGFMTEHEMKRLSRSQLLEMLVDQSKEIERLQQELREAMGQIEDRRIRMEETGSIAEAALKLSGVFEAAQQAADDFMASVALQHKEEAAKIAEQEKKAGETLAKAEESAAE